MKKSESEICLIILDCDYSGIWINKINELNKI